uniref:Uncharacterized protein n=1 Tax=uncultured Nocardioidaceae bacterium TaxID=253824 RepID=A0A6J4M4C3_9ACTN|nr:MAG: hypothetical protein AVDCRST_MAG46-2477 [uncultured Nocardioidaceae bacterium]
MVLLTFGNSNISGTFEATARDYGSDRRGPADLLGRRLQGIAGGAFRSQVANGRPTQRSLTRSRRTNVGSPMAMWARTR